MRLLFVCLVLLTLPRGSTFAAAPALVAGHRVMWTGDSITQAGHYVTFVLYYLEKAYPREDFDFVSVGRSSETVSGLSEKTHPGPRPWAGDRMPRALQLIKPTTVFACYGMNDGIYHPPSPERLRAFQTGVEKLRAMCEQAHARLVLLTPPPFTPVPGLKLAPKDAPDFSFRAPYENYDDVLHEFSEWEITLPARSAPVIDLHGPMGAYIKNERQSLPAFSFSKDGIHPNLAGHLLMARIILRGLGVSLQESDADLNQELVRIEADPLYALIKRQREIRSAAWLAYVGFSGTPDQAELEVAQLQVQIDAVRRQ